jgi:hypothetical protein
MSNDDDEYIPRARLKKRYNKSEQTIWRWERQKGLSFPAAIVINGRKYYRRAELENWERCRAAS